jgi:hypothetical protein
LNLVHRARLKKGRTSNVSHERLAWDAFSREPFEAKQAADQAKRRPPNKIHPVLEKWISERGADTKPLIVTFRDDLRIPRFPEPALKEPRTSPMNKRATRTAKQLVAQIQERRAERYNDLIQDLREYRVRVLETFWLINAALVEAPLGVVRELAERDDILYIEPRHAGEKPPGPNGNPNDDVDVGRARIDSDPYFNLGLQGGFIGLLDTGLRFTHTLLGAPSTIALRRDCVNGGHDCTAGPRFNPNDNCWDHGTASAAVITGNANQGNAFRGVTAITLDSFKVYPSRCGLLDACAVVRAFQAAVGALDWVIVAEMQGGGDDLSAISTAADHAFDAGAVIIAANGNNGPGPGTVNAPANAHRVLGVGSFDVQTQSQDTGQSLGPAPDGRVKPDIQAPTSSETASDVSDTAFQTFGGTSGATPYAAGAAALLRNWLHGTSSSTDPGQVYAQLILAGQQPYPFDNTIGAGPLQLPTDGWAWWGKVSVSNGMTIDIPLAIGDGAHTLDGALWWPECAFQFSLNGPTEVHNDVDLDLVDPQGVVCASSVSIPSVFERARVDGAVAAGTWQLRIRGYQVNETQTVYWAAYVRTS